MNIPQPLQIYCEAIMQIIITKVKIPGTDWFPSLYTGIDRKIRQQVWYEHAILFPVPGDPTEFCVELNYEPQFGLRCAYGIRKDKPKKRKFDVSLVYAFKTYSSNPYFEFNKLSSYKSDERLDPDHWIVWRFFNIPFSVNQLMSANNSNINSSEVLGHIEAYMSPLVDDINKFFAEWRNVKC